MTQPLNMEDVVSVSIQLSSDSTPQDNLLDVKIHYSDSETEPLSGILQPKIGRKLDNSYRDVIEDELSSNLQKNEPTEELTISKAVLDSKQLKLHILNEELYDQLDLLRKDNEILRNQSEKLQDDLTDSNIEKENLARNYDERLVNLTSYCQTLSQEMEELEESNNSLLKQLDSTSELLKTLEDKYKSKSQKCEELNHLIETRDNSAEIMLLRQEKVNKELVEMNSKLQRKSKELEKKLEEYSTRYNKLRQEILQIDLILKERDEQMYKALKRIKIQDAQISELQKDNRNKETAVAKLHKALQGINIDAQRELNFKLEKELKTALCHLAGKEDEVEVLRDLVKSYQIQFKQKEFEVTRLRKNYKLNPLVKEPIIDPHLSTNSLKTTVNIRKIIRIPETTSPSPVAAKANIRYGKDKPNSLSSTFNKTSDLNNQSIEYNTLESDPIFEAKEDSPKEISAEMFTNTKLSEFQPDISPKQVYEMSIDDLEDLSQVLELSSLDLDPQQSFVNNASKLSLKVLSLDSVEDSLLE